MTKEEREELNEQIELTKLEIAALEEGEKLFKENDNANLSTPIPAMRKFMEARLKYVQKKLAKLLEKDKAAKDYEEWDRRTKA